MTGKTWVSGTFLIILFFTVKLSSAQSDTVTSETPVNMDTGYLEDYTKLLTARLFLLFQNASLLINPDVNRISGIVYRPNANVRIGIAAFWRWFGLGFSIDNPFYKTDRNAMGRQLPLISGSTHMDE